MNSDLKIIKKKFGEEMMHFCRDAFSSILETEGKLSRILLDHFEPSHSLYSDLINSNTLEDFKKYIYSFIGKKKKKVKTNKTPEELMNETGYDLFECKTEKDIQKFKKYYAKGEELCTFSGGRLDSCRVFFAVKKNVNEIKRDDFKNPERQDEYGTSVISIQFTKGDNYLSIKNRYNHTVTNPDATFSNNLDNIIPGLTDSFERFYGIIQKYQHSDLEIPYYEEVQGKYYKYNCEMRGIYFCPNNVVIDNFEVKRLPKEKYILLEYFVLDLQNKTIESYKNIRTDSFVQGLKDIKDINIEKNNDGKIIYITPENGEEVKIQVDKENNIIGYENVNLKEVNGFFLDYNERLRELYLPNVVEINGFFLKNNKALKKIYIPKVEEIGSYFLEKNLELEELVLPEVKNIGLNFLKYNVKLKKLESPKLTKASEFFLFSNNTLTKLDLPMLGFMDIASLQLNNSLKEFYAPKLSIVGYYVLKNNTTLEKLELPNLSEYNYGFLANHPTFNGEMFVEQWKESFRKRYM